MNRSCKQVIQIPKFLHSLTVLSSFKHGNHSNQELDRLRKYVRSNSREYLRLIQEYGDAQVQSELVNVEYGRMMAVSFSTAGGIDEEDDDEIRSELNCICYFLREQLEGRNAYQPFFQPLPLLARMSAEQIEEEGGNEEIESQLNSNGNNGSIKYYTKYAKAVILNHFIDRR
ncbi:MAG: hypothetical protein EZS28_031665 [Streblomastix strix]|uniref:Uncharacterized protein n=1 Tax=Streblomastix strix TaxID=222440 RepID=A0A5J4UQU5_9EUKA|nr:MAG: hypothetical protein EZS28_031665 [Streblomastix strix]